MQGFIAIKNPDYSGFDFNMFVVLFRIVGNAALEFALVAGGVEDDFNGRGVNVTEASRLYLVSSRNKSLAHFACSFRVKTDVSSHCIDSLMVWSYYNATRSIMQYFCSNLFTVHPFS